MTVRKSSVSIDVINEEMLIDFLMIITWSKQNKLPINYDKTTQMILGARRCIQVTYELALNIDNKTTEKVRKQKLLGFFIDEHLILGQHTLTNYVQLFPCTKINIVICAARHTKTVLSKLHVHLALSGLWMQYAGSYIEYKY